LRQSRLPALLVLAPLAGSCAPASAPNASDADGLAWVTHLTYVAAESPTRTGFLIGRFEVTWEEWERVEGDRPSPSSTASDPLDFPVRFVTASEADAFAATLGARLPTKWEWERAGSPAGEAQARFRFPWGQVYTPERCNGLELRLFGPTRVGTFESGKSPWECYDLAGNVREWTSTQVGRRRVVKGGSFQTSGARSGRGESTPSNLEIFADQLLEPGVRQWDLGFRLVVDPVEVFPRLARRAAESRLPRTSDDFDRLVRLGGVAPQALRSVAGRQPYDPDVGPLLFEALRVVRESARR